METTAPEPGKRYPVDGRPGFFKRWGPRKGWQFGFAYRDSEGRLQQPCRWSSLKEAQAARREIETRKHRGEHVAPHKRTFGEVADEWLVGTQQRLRPNSARSIDSHLRLHLKPALGARKIQEISFEDLAEYVRRKQELEGLGSSALDAHLSIARRVFEYAERRDWMSGNPVRKLVASERPKDDRRRSFALSPEALRLLLEAIEEHRAQIFYTTLAFSGLRIGEGRGLTWGAIDFTAGEINVTASLGRDGLGPPKTPASARRVKIFPALCELLLDFRAGRDALPPPDESWVPFAEAARVTGFSADTISRWVRSGVLPGERGRRDRGRVSLPAAQAHAALPFAGRRRATVWSRERPTGEGDFVFAGLSEGMLRRELIQARERIGLDNVTPHTLRHTYGSMLVARGTDIGYVSRQMGHKNLAVTMETYLHEYESAQHERRAREIMEEEFGRLLGNGSGNELATAALLPAGANGHRRA